MPKVCLQVGHQNVKFNSLTNMRSSTGAPQEMDKNYKITSRLAEILRTKGFEVKQTDANANDDNIITQTDWDMYLALHCDADRPNTSGGFIDWADPSTDSATKESQRIALAIESEYFKHSEIENHPERRGLANVRFYYMWQYLSAKTPCVLIEMGESIDPHDQVLLNDTERIATALARGICKAFSVNYEDSVPTPDTEAQLRKQIEELNKQLEYVKKEYEDSKKSALLKLADTERKCQEALESYKLKIKASLQAWSEREIV